MSEGGKTNVTESATLEWDVGPCQMSESTVRTYRGHNIMFLHLKVLALVLDVVTPSASSVLRWQKRE
jgi:hypothetical protein